MLPGCRATLTILIAQRINTKKNFDKKGDVFLLFPQSTRRCNLLHHDHGEDSARTQWIFSLKLDWGESEDRKRYWNSILSRHQSLETQRINLGPLTEAGLQKVVQGPRLCCRVWSALVCSLLGSGNLLWGTEGRIGPPIQKSKFCYLCVFEFRSKGWFGKKIYIADYYLGTWIQCSYFTETLKTPTELLPIILTHLCSWVLHHLTLNICNVDACIWISHPQFLLSSAEGRESFWGMIHLTHFRGLQHIPWTAQPAHSDSSDVSASPAGDYI